MSAEIFAINYVSYTVIFTILATIYILRGSYGKEAQNKIMVKLYEHEAFMKSEGMTKKEVQEDWAYRGLRNDLDQTRHIQPAKVAEAIILSVVFSMIFLAPVASALEAGIAYLLNM